MAVAITKAIKKYVSSFEPKNDEPFPISIKWPNDIYSGLKKIGGIIISSNYYEGTFTIVIGVGLNLDNSQPTTCVNEMIENYNKKHKKNVPLLTPSVSLALILGEFEEIYNDFSLENVPKFLDEYYQHWMHSEQKVTLQTEDNSVQHVVIRGLTKAGFLDAVTEDGKQAFELHPNGNSFDMMKNLISKKQ
jgi:biotin--protein ligase